MSSRSQRRASSRLTPVKAAAKPDPRPASQRGIVAAICLALVVATAVTYWPITGNQFVDYDDGRYVRDNAVVKKGFTAEGLRYAFTTREGACASR